MRNMEYITSLLYWLVKSNGCKGIQEVRSRIIFCQRKHELSVLKDFQNCRYYFFQKIQIGRLDVTNAGDFRKSRLYISKKISQKRESKNCESLWKLISYRLIAVKSLFYREVFCILFLLGIFSCEKIFSCFFGRFATSGSNCKLSVKYIDVISHAFTSFVSMQKVP